MFNRKQKPHTMEACIIINSVNNNKNVPVVYNINVKSSPYNIDSEK